MFKIGQRVKCIKEYQNLWSGTTVNKGTVLTVHRIHHDKRWKNSYFASDNTKPSSWIHKEYFVEVGNKDTICYKPKNKPQGVV